MTLSKEAKLIAAITVVNTDRSMTLLEQHRKIKKLLQEYYNEI